MYYFQEFDRAILQWLNHLAQASQISQSFFLNSAFLLIYLVPVLLIALWFVPRGELLKNKILSIQMVLAGLFAWQVINKLLSLLVDRPRPGQNIYVNVQELVFHRPDKTFPSDHAAFLFSLTATLYLLGYRKIANASLVVSIVISIARIATGLHYPTDIIVGALVGIFSAVLFKALQPTLTKYFYQPLINLLAKLKLAKL